jgi:hypothetical protein
MSTQQRTADEQLRQAVAAFERSFVAAPERPVPALSAVANVLRAVAALTRFAVGLALDADRSDPIDLEPRILRAA